MITTLTEFLIGLTLTVNSTGDIPPEFRRNSLGFIQNTIVNCELRIEQLKAEAEAERIRQEQLRIEAELEAQRKANVSFDPYDLRSLSHINYDEMYAVLEGSGLEDIAWCFVDSEEYNVNAFLIASIVALESGWSSSAKARNYNNLGGVGVYDDNTRGKVYSSRSECVFDIANFLRRDYLTEGGAYYNGYSVWDVNIKYSKSSSWADKVVAIAYELLNKYNKIYR